MYGKVVQLSLVI
ncbi:CPXV218 protein [Cowpox virus]|uniref:CPXV218 protein n=1 Tax=Cowpox virus TaxID=10243 RepID=U5TBP5_COWPX|nr:CPXV218 protein [Cowpox virus]